jgi:hypothetical protein
MDGSNTLTAVVCTSVSFFLGVLVARVFPTALGFDLGNLAEWVAASSALATAVIAGLALSSWRKQVRAAAAAAISEAAALARFHFYDARNPFYSGAEFPE